MLLPPRKGTNVPTALKTRLNMSGRCHAALNEAMPPLLSPKMAQSLAWWENLIWRPSGVVIDSTAGNNSCSKNSVIRLSVMSYSLLRLYLKTSPSVFLILPGSMKTPIVTGILPSEISSSKTSGALHCMPSKIINRHASC